MTDEELDALIGLSGARELAERQLIEMLREPEQQIELRIMHDGGRWSIRMDSQDDNAGPGSGEGETFAEAWHRIGPWWATNVNNNKKGY